MIDSKRITVFILAACLMLAVAASCSSQTSQQPVYDPSKQYASFLVLKNPNYTASLEDAKRISSSEGYEIGPVEYYSAGLTDFEPILRRLVPNKQITLLWVAGNIMDVRNIQKAVSKISYKGQVRYAQSPAAPGSGLPTQ